MSNYTLHLGDALETLRGMEAHCVDAIVCDPPAGIAFMNKSWDKDRGGRRQWVAWMTDIAAECLRVIKPGGHALVWALPRTSHWTATAWEDAGFEIRDCVYHLFGSGFPKSHSVSAAIDKHFGMEREVIGSKVGLPGYSLTDGEPGGVAMQGNVNGSLRNGFAECAITAPATDAAKQYRGFGSALKPAVECWWLLRAPLSEPTIAANVLKHGTGAINVDACRVGTNGERPTGSGNRDSWRELEGREDRQPWNGGNVTPEQGRWPPNLLLDPEAAALLDQMSGVSGGGKFSRSGTRTMRDNPVYGAPNTTRNAPDNYGDQGGASRFFPIFAHDDDEPLRMCYQPKASKRDRDEGLEGMPEQPTAAMQGNLVDGQRLAGNGTPVRTPMRRNVHPTVKPTPLMRWLVRLITPPGGTVLDNFCGSGSTLKAAILEGFDCIGIDNDAEYVELARARCAHAAAQYAAAQAQPLLLEAAG